MKCPCRGCDPPKRHMHCRLNCEPYKEYEKSKLEEYRLKGIEKEKYNTQSEAAKKTIWRRMGRKK